MSKMLGKSGKVSFRPKCPCCNMSESDITDKQRGKQIKRAREKREWMRDQRI